MINEPGDFFLGWLFGGLFMAFIGCSSTPKPTAADLEKACPAAARVMTIDCPALALRMCHDAPSLDECDARQALEAECDRLIQTEVDKCP